MEGAADIVVRWVHRLPFGQRQVIPGASRALNRNARGLCPQRVVPCLPAIAVVVLPQCIARLKNDNIIVHCVWIGRNVSF